VRLPRIDIQSQLGSLATKTRNAKQEGTPPDLEISIRGNNGAEVGIKTTRARIFIDQSDSFEVVGFGGSLRRMKKFAAESNQKGIAQIGRIAREGVMCMRIERGGSGERAISRIARNKGLEGFRRAEMADIPPPKITAQMGSVQIYDRSGKVQTNTYETADTQKYTSGVVTHTWGVKPWMNISFIPGTPPGGAFVDSIV